MQASDLKALKEIRPLSDHGLEPEQRLALAVLSKAVSDVRCGNAYRLDAAAFLESARSDFWLQVLGATRRGRDRLRSEAAKISRQARGG
ncbi:MAG TPA: hypothetical protein VLV83_16335 [Acidobacteriota bacterium]|nr:hypothetical protein [Acidobacteriota bacterium]